MSGKRGVRREARRSTEERSASGGTGRGERTKATVVLFNHQIVFLDRLAADIRARTGAVLKRATIIRALIEGLAESGVDVSHARSEEELTAFIAERLRS
jgi:hypothetical protein